MDQDVGQSGHRQPRVPGMPAAAMGHGAGRYRPMPKTQMHGLSRHQGPQTIARSGRQASQQPVQFARRPVDAGILRQSIVPATNPHHGALGHGRGNSVSAESSPAKVSRGGRSAPRSKISGNVHSANVPRLGSYELTPVASCGKPRDRHPVPLRGHFDTNTPRKQPGSSPYRGKVAPHGSVVPQRRNVPPEETQRDNVRQRIENL